MRDGIRVTKRSHSEGEATGSAVPWRPYPEARGTGLRPSLHRRTLHQAGFSPVPMKWLSLQNLLNLSVRFWFSWVVDFKLILSFVSSQSHISRGEDFCNHFKLISLYPLFVLASDKGQVHLACMGDFFYRQRSGSSAEVLENVK